MDSGKTFRQNGLSITTDTMTNGTWNLISINAGADPAINNSNKFIFRIRTTPQNKSTSGNHRYDNFTVEGDTIYGVPLYKIRALRGQNSNGVADSANKGIGFIKGVVMSPSFSSSNLQFSLVDSTGWMTIFTSKIKYYTPTIGDSLLIHGTLTQFNGVDEYTADSITVLTKGTWLAIPKVVTQLSETNESGLITINGVHIIDSTTWKPAGTGFNVNIVDNNKDTFVMRICSPVDLFKKGYIHAIFNVTGIETQFKSSSPFIGGYEIEPRSISDITPVKFSPIYKIRQLRGQNAITGVADSLNKGIGYIKGVVHSPSFSATSLQFSLLDSTGAITIFSSKIKYYTPKIGDSVIIHGTLTQFNGVDEYTADTIITYTNGTWLKTPAVTSVMNESFESSVITINGVHIIDSTTWKPAGSGFNVNIVDNKKDTFVMRIGSTIDLFKKGYIHGIFNVTGIETQFKSSSPFIGGYEIEPRGISDITPVKFAPLYKIRQLRGQNSITGIADSLNKGIGYIKGVVHSPSFSATSLQFSLLDSTGAITIFSSKIKYYTPNVGDSLLVHGTLTQFNGVDEYTADSIITLVNGTWLKLPTVVTHMNETYESSLITINNVHIIDTTKWLLVGSGFNINIADNNKDTFIMRINATVDLFKKGPIHGSFSVTGIETQFKTSSPYIGAYQIEPRSISDILPAIPSSFKPIYKIRQVRPQDLITGVADSLNKSKGYLKGVVMSPSFSTSYLQFSLLDSTGAITAFTSTIKYYTPVVGDSLIVHGTLTQFNGVTEYTLDTIVKLNPGSWLKTPDVVTALGENEESSLITINDVHIIDTTKWLPAGTGFNINIVDNKKDTFVMRITNATDLFKMKVIKGNFNVTGVETQFKSASPFLGGYQIEPRSFADIKILPPYGLPLYKIRQIRTQNAITGVADSLNKGKGFIKGVVVSPTYSTSYLQFSLVDSTGAITIFTSTVKYYTPSIGDSILAHGLTTQFNGVTEYTTDTIIVLKKGTAIETPTVLTAFDEVHESHLVKVKNVHIIDPTQWTGSGTGFNVNITDGKDTFVMRITSAIDLFKQTAIKGNFNCTGVETQFKSASPFIGGYEIEPRGAFDVELIAAPKFLPLYKISQVRPQDANGVADSLNKGKGYLKGMVVSPSYSTTYLQFSLVDNTGAITIFTSTVKYYTPVIGDSIMLHGFVTQFNGVTEYTTDTIIVLPKGTIIETPSVLKTFDESHESHLVKVLKVHIIDPTQWTGAGTGFNVNITDGIDTFSMRITSAIDLFKKTPIKGNFNVTGVETQFKSASPFLGGYQIEPRGIFDIQPIPLKLYTISQVKPFDPTTGVADSLNLACWLKGVVESPNLSGSSAQFFSMADNTGAITVVALSQVNGYIPTTGDSIKVRGVVVQLNGLTAFGIDSVVKMTGGAAISPVLVTTLDETTESQLVKFTTYQLVDATKWNVSNAVNGRFMVDASNGTNTITMAITQGTDLFANSAVPTGHFDVIGIGSQNDVTAPYLQNYVLIPRSIADFNHSSGIESSNIDPGTIKIYPNPTLNFTNVVADFRMTNLVVVDIMGNIVTEQFPTSTSAIIDLSTLKPGIYFIRISNGNNFTINKIVKQ